MEDVVDDTVETKIFKTRVAEETKRYDDMANFMTEVLDHGRGSINFNERNLFCIAFKSKMKIKRDAWRKIAEYQQDEKYAQFSEAILTYLQKIETEII